MVGGYILLLELESNKDCLKVCIFLRIAIITIIIRHDVNVPIVSHSKKGERIIFLQYKIGKNTSYPSYEC